MRALTPEQEQAATRRREPLALSAGAGSGKTSVLVERFVRAVCEDGHPAERILAITFTERAAAELRERVRARLLELGVREAASRLDRGYLGTFHGFCARVLRAHPLEAGLAELGAGRFAILDEPLAARLRRRAFAIALDAFLHDRPADVEPGGESGGGLGGESARERPDAVELIAAYGPDRARAIVLGVFAQLRSAGQRLPRLPTPALAPDAQELDRRATAALVLWDELLARFVTRYEQAKRARESLDFDDLELYTVELLARDERIRHAWAERFELLMVDELQDVNPRQLALVRALERENLFTVGDEWQSIYAFRHADVSLFRAREAELARRGQSLRLAHNFRGRAELLEAVNAVFARRFGATFRPLRAGRERAREREAHAEPLIELLLSDRGEQHLSGANANASADATAAPWRLAEARLLATRVAELVRTGAARCGEVAVLLRGTADIDCYEQALREHGLPTLASAGAFWERQEIADLLAYLRALEDPADELALYGALASPFAGLTATEIALLARTAGARGASVWETAREDSLAGLSVHARESLTRLCAWLGHERALAPELELGALIERAVESFRYTDSLRLLADGDRRLANVRKLTELAREWERSEGRDLPGFLEDAAFQRGLGGGFLATSEAIAEPDAPAGGDGGAGEGVEGDRHRDAIRLMSVHAAKGLEFDVVCVADLGRAPSAAVPDLLVDGERVGLRLLDLREGRSQPVLAYEELARERREAQAAEEDRIVYVAMTRARERLLLSGAVDFVAWPKDRPGGAPIGWLASALAPEVPVLCRERAGCYRDGANLDGEDGAGAGARPLAVDVSAKGGPRARAYANAGRRLLRIADTDVALALALGAASG
jgi:ATP-dependent helicase/nuclease subunit A